MSEIAGRRGLWALLVILLAGVLLRGWALGQPGLIGDESYYWLWSKHLALSYYDNPAGVALVVRLSTLLGGQSEAGIRWLNAALGAVVVWLSYLVGRRLFSPAAGLVAAAFLATGAPYLLVSRYAYTDALQGVLILANLLSLVPFLESGPAGGEGSPAEAARIDRMSTWRYVAVGATMAALYNTKYSAYLYGFAVVGFLAWRRRRFLGHWRTWLAIAIPGCGLLPVLLWNTTHGWASFRWQWAHLTRGEVSLLGNLVHALRYVTPPLALAATLGVLRWRGVRRQLLLVAAAVLILPVALSPADSPRNLLSGLILLVLLSGDGFATWMRARRGRVVRVGVLLLWAASTLYGLGTVAATLRPVSLPHSPAAASLRREGAGWRTAVLGLDRETPVFALDYQAAGQMWFYGGLPVSTAWPQYRLWEGPRICAQGKDASDAAQIVSLAYLDRAVVSDRLSASFDVVEGPRRVPLGDTGVEKDLFVWRVRGCLIDEDAFLERFDYLQLAGGLP